MNELVNSYKKRGQQQEKQKPEQTDNIDQLQKEFVSTYNSQGWNTAKSSNTSNQTKQNQFADSKQNFNQKIENEYADYLSPNLLKIKTPQDQNRLRSNANSRQNLQSRDKLIPNNKFGETNFFPKTVRNVQTSCDNNFKRKRVVITPNSLLQGTSLKSGNQQGDEAMKDFIDQSLKKSYRKDKTLKYWTKVKDKNSNYHMEKKGFQPLLKEIQESTQNLQKIRGGTSIYQDSSLKDIISSKSNAPMFEDRNLISSIKNILDVSPSECDFERKLTQNAISHQYSAFTTLNERLAKSQLQTINENQESQQTIEKSKRSIFRGDSVVFQQRNQHQSVQTIKKSFHNIIYPSNPALFVQRGGGLFNSHSKSSPLNSRQSQSRFRSQSPFDDKIQNQASKQDSVISSPQLSFMKDFCKKEQVFFNENDRISFLKQRSKNHFRMYKKAFENTTSILFNNDKELMMNQSQRNLQQSLAKLDPQEVSTIPQNIPFLKDSKSKDQKVIFQSTQIDNKNQLSKLMQKNIVAKKDFSQTHQQPLRLQPIVDEKQQKIRAEFEKFSRILDSGKMIPMKKFRKRRQTTDPINKLSRTLQRYKNQREQSEEQLIRTIEKVKLDKTILFREKIETIWKDQLYITDSDALKYDLLKQKTKRKDQYLKQVDSYNILLKFLKERASLPVAEEKQILDALKIVLDNQWVVGQQEILQIFDLVGLNNGKIKIDYENLSFLEFIYLIAKLYDIELKKIQDYFLISQ
eukprot:403370583